MMAYSEVRSALSQCKDGMPFSSRGWASCMCLTHNAKAGRGRLAAASASALELDGGRGPGRSTLSHQRVNKI